MDNFKVYAGDEAVKVAARVSSTKGIYDVLFKSVQVGDVFSVPEKLESKIRAAFKYRKVYVSKIGTEGDTVFFRVTSDLRDIR